MALSGNIYDREQKKFSERGSETTINVSILDASGNQITSFGGAGGTSHADDAAFSIGSASSITPAGYLADEAAPDSVDEGDVGVPRMTLSRKPYAVITDPTSEQNAAVDSSGRLSTCAALVAGTNCIGDVGFVDALPAGDNNIGNVDIVTVPAPLSTTGGGTEATALRVTIANNSTGVLSIDDNGGSLTIDGTVTADAGSGTFTVTDDGSFTLAANSGVDIGDVDVTSTPKSSTGTHGNITVTTSSTTVMAANANRLGLLIKNNGTQTVFLNFGGTAVVTNYPLEAGESYTDDGDACFTGVIKGIVSDTTLNLRVVEFT